jgi:hypothetical protein
MPGRNPFSIQTGTVAQDLPLAQKRSHTRRWEKEHPARRYLIPVEVRDQVAALAEALMENVDPLACVLFDYADTCHTRGTLKFQPRLNPQGRKHHLSWEEASAAPLKGQTAAYRLGEERHVKLKVVAEAYNLRLADILGAFFRHSLQAYRDGKLKIRREPVVMQMQVKGWSE